MYRWPGGILSYDLSQEVCSEHAALIRNTLSQLETKLDSCIKFREVNSGPWVVVGDRGVIRAVKVKSSPLPANNFYQYTKNEVDEFGRP